MAGCGCGAARGRCQCGRATVSPAGAPIHENGISRPTFFAGQVLCEDDLGAIVSYQLTKSRLHNRFLHGSGVVCGLEVKCNPRNPGRTVIIEPGYALGCGDEIYVPCRTVIDVVELIQTLTFDGCNEPCPPKVVTEASKSDEKDAQATAPKGIRYLLGVEYAERFTAEALTYAVECGMEPTCEPTRVVEGYQFSLRPAPACVCEGVEPAEPTGIDRVLRERFVRDQRLALSDVCDALNPPCPTGDGFVVLAELTIDACEVTDICQAARHYALTFPTVRYWLGALGEFERLLHERCCCEPTAEPAPIEDKGLKIPDTAKSPRREKVEESVITLAADPSASNLPGMLKFFDMQFAAAGETPATKAGKSASTDASKKPAGGPK